MINGRKQWISNGGIADAYTILANTPGGPSWFVIERGADGLHPGQARGQARHPAEQHRRAVPRRRPGRPRRAGRRASRARACCRPSRCSATRASWSPPSGWAAGWSALDKAIAYSTERIQAGGPAVGEAGVHPQADRPARGPAGGRPAPTSRRRPNGSTPARACLNTEGAIAKYLATEAGNAAAEAAIQAHGGYGYTREYLVEKIKRDVRITTIYEGTSEIMEMTIARDRWQEHLKTRGRYYHDRADALEALDGTHPGVGAGTAALALHALAEVLEWCRTGRLTRQQHVLLRLGELIAYAECAEALSRRAARAADGDAEPQGRSAGSTPPGWPCWPGCSPATPPCGWRGAGCGSCGAPAGPTTTRLAELESGAADPRHRRRRGGRHRRHGRGRRRHLRRAQERTA